MGISKQQLKSIVKECLVEILSEGMGHSTGNALQEVSKRQPSRVHPTSHMSFAPQKSVSRSVQTSNLKEAIRSESGGNSVLADILADTAATTLPVMLENDRTKLHAAPTGRAENLVASYAPEQLFGEEAASKWADLAFMGASKK